MNGRQEKLFKKEYALELMRIAEGDYVSATALADSELGRPENVLLLTQQSLEKALKAVLCWHGKKIPLVREMGTILAKLPDEWNTPFGYELDELSQFAKVRRYVESVEDFEPDEIKETLQCVRNVLDWCSVRVGAGSFSRT
jgi:HEPN domain-containing protein